MSSLDRDADVGRQLQQSDHQAVDAGQLGCTESHYVPRRQSNGVTRSKQAFVKSPMHEYVHQSAGAQLRHLVPYMHPILSKIPIRRILERCV